MTEINLKNKKLGTFAGVFTPSILTIIGVIMYLRLGWVIGQVGIISTLLIITISSLITFTTALSLSNLATDKPIKGGGAYYIISRGLGIEIGGAIGLPLFLSQAISTTLYIAGFTESFLYFNGGGNYFNIFSITAIIICFVTLVSIGFATKIQYVIMFCIFLSILSIFFGDYAQRELIVDLSNIEHFSFWQVLAVFFPAVTGIMAGVNMSGDLENPSGSIPRGVISAVLISYLIYMSLAVFMAWNIPIEVLISDKLVLAKISSFEILFYIGLWGASLSSALGSLLSAPRVLQAICKDGVIGDKLAFLGKGYGINNEPKNAILFTFLIAFCFGFLQDLDTIATILTMFFLTVYLIVNLTCAIELILQNPSYRPRFKIPLIIPIIGFIGCAFVMFLISIKFTILSWFICLSIYFWLSKKEIEATWGDTREGLKLSLLKYIILRVKTIKDPKNWRPQLLVFSGSPSRRWGLIYFAKMLTHKRGVVTVANILSASKHLSLNSRNTDILFNSYDGFSSVNIEKAEELLKNFDEELEYKKTKAQNNLEELFHNASINGIPLIRFSNEVFATASDIVDYYGISVLSPNTVLMGDTRNNSYEKDYIRLLRKIYFTNKNLIILRGASNLVDIENPLVHLWWGGLEGNGSLMILIAHLLRLNNEWKKAEIILNTIVNSEEEIKDTELKLKSLIDEIRIFNIVLNVHCLQQESILELINKVSIDVDLTIMGLSSKIFINREEESLRILKQMKLNTKNLKTVAFVKASRDFSSAFYHK